MHARIRTHTHAHARIRTHARTARASFCPLQSTLIKILTSELKPENGGVSRHPNLRVAYVAQHAFHHLEECLDISPARYILRRYSGGEDKWVGCASTVWA